MDSKFNIRIASTIDNLQSEGNLRTLPCVGDIGEYITSEDGVRMKNISSNDYLGISTNTAIQQEFLLQLQGDISYVMSATSSRLLTGNASAYSILESTLTRLFNSEAALVFNSGYHANNGILPALVGTKSLIVADKLVHASIIDGIKLSGCKFIRYRHNDIENLKSILEKNAADYDEIFVVSESIYSMDGDIAPLKELVELKRIYPNIILYIDEAHAIGVRGENGLGCAEESGTINDIDILVGTFGKAISSVGAYVICSKQIRATLINKMRTLIFTTALPPINLLWSNFIMERLAGMKREREELANVSKMLRDGLEELGYKSESESHIIPLMVGDNQRCIDKANLLRESGYYLLPIRPPTVPQGTSRIRFSLNSSVTTNDIDTILKIVKDDL